MVKKVLFLTLLLIFSLVPECSKASFPVPRDPARAVLNIAPLENFNHSSSLEESLLKKPKKKPSSKKSSSSKKKSSKSSSKKKKKKKESPKVAESRNQWLAFVLAFPLLGLGIGFHRLYLGYYWEWAAFLVFAAISPLTPYWASLGINVIWALIDAVRILLNKLKPRNAESYAKRMFENQYD